MNDLMTMLSQFDMDAVMRTMNKLIQCTAHDACDIPECVYFTDSDDVIETVMLLKTIIDMNDLEE